MERLKRSKQLGAMGLMIIGLVLPGAAEAVEFDESGGYLVLGGLTAFETFDRGNGADVSGSSLGFEIRGGFRFARFFAVEAAGDFISGWDVDVDVPGGTGQLVLEGGNITVNAKAYLPLGRFQPYALAGIGGMWADLRTRQSTGSICTPAYLGWWCSPTFTPIDNAGGFIAKFGFGTDYWVTKDWGVSVDAVYVLPTGDLEALSYWNLGWGVKFKF